MKDQCDFFIKKCKTLEAKLNHKNKKPDSYKCITCKVKTKLSEIYDAYYCPECLRWTELLCGDRKCKFCKNRPKYPKRNQK